MNLIERAISGGLKASQPVQYLGRSPKRESKGNGGEMGTVLRWPPDIGCKHCEHCVDCPLDIALNPQMCPELKTKRKRERK